MKINKVSAEAFAGKRDIDIKFKDGINIIYGKNETGKSTIVELIRKCLFQNAKLKKTIDKDFIDKYMMKSAEGKQSSTADGKLIFDDSNVEHSIKREWNDKGTSKYFDGTIDYINDDDIKKELDKVLKYNEAVYNEIVFSSQKFDQKVIESIFDACSSKDVDIKKDLKSILNKAASSIGNVDEVKIREGINAKIKKLGDHFDMSQGLPDGGLAKVKVGNRWKIEVGSILKKYYELEDVKNEKENVQNLEEQLEELNDEISKFENDISKLEKEKELLKNSKNYISQKKLLDKYRDDLDKLNNIKENWPVYIEKYKKLKKAIPHRDAIKLIYDYHSLKSLKDSVDEFKKQIEIYKNINDDVINDCRDINDKIKDNNNKIKPLELTATINNKGNDEVKVYNILNDTIINPNGNKYDINSPFKVKVGEDVEINITPKDVDVESIKKENEELNNKLTNIYKNCDVDSFDELKNRSSEKKNINDKLSSYTTKFDNELENNGQTFEELENSYIELDDNTYVKYKNANDDEIEQEYNKSNDEIKNIIDGKDENVYLDRLETNINSYEKDYTDINNVDNRINEKNKEINRINKELEQFQDFDINDIDDVDEKLNELKSNIDSKKDSLDEKRVQLGALNNEINGRSAQSFDDTINLLENELDELKEEYGHYKHILNVFNQVMSNNKQNPLTNIETEFINNVKIITNNGINIDNSGDSLNISNGKRGLTPSILSEGTKDSIGFAFKLAVVKSLFPDEAFIVLDDPFTDMDADRVKNSCDLLNAFADKNNQVLFFTCDEKYKKLMPNANIIEI